MARGRETAHPTLLILSPLAMTFILVLLGVTRTVTVFPEFGNIGGAMDGEAHIVFSAQFDDDGTAARLPDGWHRQDGILKYSGSGFDLMYLYAHDTPDYTVELELRSDAIEAPDFAIFIRGLLHVQTYTVFQQGEASIEQGGRFQHEFRSRSFPLDDAWHLYRFESQGKHVRLLVDGSLILEADVSRVQTTAGYHAGIIGGTPIQIRSYRVWAADGAPLQD